MWIATSACSKIATVALKIKVLVRKTHKHAEMFYNYILLNPGKYQGPNVKNNQDTGLTKSKACNGYSKLTAMYE